MSTRSRKILFLVSGTLPVRRADNLTTICLYNVGSLTSHDPIGLHGLLRGIAYRLDNCEYWIGSHVGRHPLPYRDFGFSCTRNAYYGLEFRMLGGLQSRSKLCDEEISQSSAIKMRTPAVAPGWVRNCAQAVMTESFSVYRCSVEHLRRASHHE
jgi:hypothetical protein